MSTRERFDEWYSGLSYAQRVALIGLASEEIAWAGYQACAKGPLAEARVTLAEAVRLLRQGRSWDVLVSGSEQQALDDCVVAFLAQHDPRKEAQDAADE